MNLTEILRSHGEWLTSEGTKGARADLSCGDYRWANLRGADLRWANLRRARLRRARLRGANLNGADLRGADLSDADLRGADLSGADLRAANLRSADLRSADLRWADLRCADLLGAGLLVLQLPIWTAYVQQTHTRIGCQYHANDQWRGFSDEQIDAMDDEALDWWGKHKQVIFAAMDAVEGKTE